MILNKSRLRRKAKKVKWFFADVDGSLTDGCTYYSARGEEMKKFSHIDGTGFMLLRKAGIKFGFITGEDTEIVTRRAEKLKADKCFLGANNKLAILKDFAEKENITLDEIAYLGDDLNDLVLFENVGLTFAPSDARKEILVRTDIRCHNKGGHGALREAAEIILSFKGIKITELLKQN
jgi:YrbI family 3-deoxy-D-manno-octulosonate 8-phosphate phosphatase